MTAQELKNSILQLAMQGKLVPQCKDDESASELLKRIEQEESVLIRAGKIKKYKVLSRLSPNDYAFDIPESWIWVKLGYICQLLDGVKICGKEYPYLEAKYLRGKADATILNEGKFVEKGTRLILVDGENSGEVFTATEDGYVGSTFKVLFFPQALFEGYVLNFLLLKKAAFRNNKTGSAIPHLNKELFFNMPFPIPPFAEQKRIVEKIEELMPLIEEYDKAEEQLDKLNAEFPDKLRKSILQQAVQGKLTERDPADEPASVLLKRIKAEKEALIKSGKKKKEQPLPAITDDEKPFDIPEQWCSVRIGDVGIYKKGPFGSSLTKSMFVPKSPDAVKVYEQKNAIQKNHTLGEYYITRDYFEKKMRSFEIFPGDIIVSCAGTIGETYVMPENIEQGIINQALMRMKIVPSVDLDYFLLYFDYILKSEAQNSSKGSAIKNIPPFEILKNMVLPIPPLAEQKRIVKRVEELLALCDEMKGV